MPDIYEQHKAAFARVSAYVVLKDGQHVGSVALKFPRDRRGRLYAYVHFFGKPMVRGFASGERRHKETAAVFAALDKLGLTYEPDGHEWIWEFEYVGFTVLRAV